MAAADLDDAPSPCRTARPTGSPAGSTRSTPPKAAHWLDRVEVGNAYVNRAITGAIVQRQPFGGWKRSVVGPGAKAGGPNYVAQLGHWTNTGSAVARGRGRPAIRSGGPRSWPPSTTPPACSARPTSSATGRSATSWCASPPTPPRGDVSRVLGRGRAGRAGRGDQRRPGVAGRPAAEHRRESADELAAARRRRRRPPDRVRLRGRRATSRRRLARRHLPRRPCRRRQRPHRAAPLRARAGRQPHPPPLRQPHPRTDRDPSPPNLRQLVAVLSTQCREFAGVAARAVDSVSRSGGCSNLRQLVAVLSTQCRKFGWLMARARRAAASARSAGDAVAKLRRRVSVGPGVDGEGGAGHEGDALVDGGGEEAAGVDAGQAGPHEHAAGRAVEQEPAAELARRGRSTSAAHCAS